MSTTETYSEEELRVKIRKSIYNQAPRMDPKRVKEQVERKVMYYREHGLVEDEE